MVAVLMAVCAGALVQVSTEPYGFGVGPDVIVKYPFLAVPQ